MPGANGKGEILQKFLEQSCEIHAPCTHLSMTLSQCCARALGTQAEFEWPEAMDHIQRWLAGWSVGVTLHSPSILLLHLLRCHRSSWDLAVLRPCYAIH